MKAVRAAGHSRKANHESVVWCCTLGLDAQFGGGIQLLDQGLACRQVQTHPVGADWLDNITVIDLATTLDQDTVVGQPASVPTDKVLRPQLSFRVPELPF